MNFVEKKDPCQSPAHRGIKACCEKLRQDWFNERKASTSFVPFWNEGSHRRPTKMAILSDFSSASCMLRLRSSKIGSVIRTPSRPSSLRSSSGRSWRRCSRASVQQLVWRRSFFTPFVP